MKQGWITDLCDCGCNLEEHYVNDLIHCEDGPARLIYDLKEWYYKGIYMGSSDCGYTQEKFEEWKKFRAFL